MKIVKMTKTDPKTRRVAGLVYELPDSEADGYLKEGTAIEIIRNPKPVEKGKKGDK